MMLVQLTLFPSVRNGTLLSVKMDIGGKNRPPESIVECRNSAELYARREAFTRSGAVPPGSYTAWPSKANKTQRAFPGFDKAAEAMRRELITVEPTAEVGTA